MKRARYNIAPAILFGLCLGMTGACGPKKPPGTNPPGDGDSDGRRGSRGGGRGSDKGDNTMSDAGNGDTSDGGEESSGAAPTSCEAKVAETPTLLFGDQVIIRPPDGVEFVPDDNPMVQQAMMSSGFMSACDAIVKRMLITVYEMNKKKKPAALMDEFIGSLAKQGYENGSKSSVYVDTDTDYHLSMEYAGGGGAPATVLYLAVARRGDKDFVVVMETTPDDFKLLKPTFEASAQSLFIVPPDA